jgi:hypothetical protein
MMGADREGDLVLLMETPGKVHPDGGVRTLDVVIHRLADIVKQTRPPRQGFIQSEFRGHHPRQAGDFNGVLEHALPEAGPVAQRPEVAHQFRMQPVHA